MTVDQVELLSKLLAEAQQHVSVYRRALHEASIYCERFLDRDAAYYQKLFLDCANSHSFDPRTIAN